MKKMLTILALALTVSVQAQNDTLGVSKFTAIYLYECNTTNAAGEPVTDSKYGAMNLYFELQMMALAFATSPASSLWDNSR